VLIGGIVLGLVLGLAAGGSIWNLGTVRLERVGLLFGAVIVRFATEAAITAGVDLADTYRLPLFALAYAMLIAGLWWNRAHPGLSLALVGIVSNAIAIVVNGGFMPIWQPSLAAAGLSFEELGTVFHRLLDANLDAKFLLQAGPLGDVIPIPFPPVQNVASIGDVFLSIGLAFFLFATVLRSSEELDEEELEAVRRRLTGLVVTAPRPAAPGVPGAVRPATGLVPGLSEAAVLDRPPVIGASPPTLHAPSEPAISPLDAQAVEAPDAVAPTRPHAATAVDASATTPIDAAAASALEPGGPRDATATTRVDASAMTRPDAGSITAVDGGAAALDITPRPTLAPRVTERALRHPYVRLALNPNFSALWAGQLISLFGDRIHQIALAFLVLNATDSAIATAGVFIAATLPNLFFSPIAGTFVDRWDQREVLVVSDLLRAALILLVPIAAVINIYLVYPLTFLVTTISIFFRPARVAVLPRIVEADELLPANSALWIAETTADVVGYPLAGLFVAFLGAALPLAFWIDGATYLASAALLWTLVVPPVARAVGAERDERQPGFRNEMAMGWEFLRRDPTLLANTLQAAIAQFTFGILLALTAVYARDTILAPAVEPESAYAFLETGIGIGNLVGGIIVGLVGSRFGRGRMVIFGYALGGASIALLGATNQLPIAFGLMIGSGIGNMIFVIPSQTMFQQRTPAELMGRVVGFRFALVFGSMTLAMAVGGILGDAFGPAPVIAVFGVLTMLAGLAGLFVPAVREA
jgi:MFS transporter, DHA3 family, macrolide efflux protein